MVPKILISPSLETRAVEIEKILTVHLKGADSNFSIKTHPDILYFEVESKLGIEQARKIKEHLFFKPYVAKGKVVVLEDASLLTLEAQNALLKILEEPPLNTLIILGAPNDSTFIPTILSRCEVAYLVTTSDVERSKYTKDIEQLLKSDIAERFEYIEKLKDKGEFLNALLEYFHQQLPSHKNFTAELLEAEKWANQNVNIRAILEYLMLIMPNE